MSRGRAIHPQPEPPGPSGSPTLRARSLRLLGLPWSPLRVGLMALPLPWPELYGRPPAGPSCRAIDRSIGPAVPHSSWSWPSRAAAVGARPWLGRAPGSRSGVVAERRPIANRNGPSAGEGRWMTVVKPAPARRRRPLWTVPPGPKRRGLRGPGPRLGDRRVALGPRPLRRPGGVFGRRGCFEPVRGLRG